MGIPSHHLQKREIEEQQAGHRHWRERAGHIVAIQEMIGRWPGRSQEAACGMESERIPFANVGASVLATDELIALRQRLEPLAVKLRFIEYPTVEDVQKALA